MMRCVQPRTAIRHPVQRRRLTAVEARPAFVAVQLFDGELPALPADPGNEQADERRHESARARGTQYHTRPDYDKADVSGRRADRDRVEVPARGSRPPDSDRLRAVSRTERASPAQLAAAAARSGRAVRGGADARPSRPHGISAQT